VAYFLRVSKAIELNSGVAFKSVFVSSFSYQQPVRLPTGRGRVFSFHTHFFSSSLLLVGVLAICSSRLGGGSIMLCCCLSGTASVKDTLVFGGRPRRVFVVVHHRTSRSSNKARAWINASI
jgi:hypothetical protein